MNNNNFTMLSNHTVWNYKESGNTLIKKYGNKVVYALCYLDGYTNRFGKCIFSIGDMISFCGLKVDTHKGKSVEEFRNLLIGLANDEIIKELSCDLNKVKQNELIRCELNIKINKNKDGNNSEFFTINRDSFEKIIDEDTKSKKHNLINVYSYICARIYSRKDDTACSGGKAEVFNGSDKTFMDDLLISKATLNNCLKDLKDLGLIEYGNIGIVANNKGKKMASNVYALRNNEFEEGLKQSKDFYKESGYSLKKEAVKLDNQINGTKGAIRKAEKNGKDTTELRKKLEKLQSQSDALTTVNRKEVIDDIQSKFKFLDRHDKEGDITGVYDNIYCYLDNDKGENTIYDCSYERLLEIQNEMNKMCKIYGNQRVSNLFGGLDTNLTGKVY